MRTAHPAGPARSAVEQLRPCGRKQQKRPVDLAHEGFEQIAKIVLRPVHVLDQHNARPLGDECVEELDPRVVEALTRHERVQVFGWHQADGEAKERVVAEPPDQFDAWAQQQAQPAAPSNLPGQQVFLQNTCVDCHAIRGRAPWSPSRG